MGRPRKIFKQGPVKETKRNTSKKDILQAENVLCNSSNLHEMETQVIDMDDTDDNISDVLVPESSPLKRRSTRSRTNLVNKQDIEETKRSSKKLLYTDDEESSSSSESLSPPSSPVHQRRTRSSTNGNKAVEKISTRRNPPRRKTASDKPENVTKNSSFQAKRKGWSKLSKDANSPKSKKYSEGLDISCNKTEQDDNSDTRASKDLTDFMANLNASPTSTREEKCKNDSVGDSKDENTLDSSITIEQEVELSDSNFTKEKKLANWSSDCTTNQKLEKSDTDSPTEEPELKKSENESPTELVLAKSDIKSSTAPELAKSDIESPTEPEFAKAENKSPSELDLPKSDNEMPTAASECPQQNNVPLSNEGTSGKLRSSVADAEGMALARGYKKSLAETEEFALSFISQECHHPVITCFRELTRRDVSHIVGNSKLKKSCSSLEQSIVYLGLIDFLATVNNNPVYGEAETSKLSKNISGTVQKVLLEFKNILGTWALSCNEQLSGRYTLILNYLRTLTPMFRKAGFDTELTNILDCIEKEVNRHKQNQEKIKAMSNVTRGSENSTDIKLSTDTSEGDNRSALNEIILNVDLNVKLDDSDEEEEVAVLKEQKSLQIFGKPLKGSPRISEPHKKKARRTQATNDPRSNDSLKSQTSHQQNSDKLPKALSTANSTPVSQPKKLAKVFNTSKTSASKIVNSTVRSPSTKRSATENLTDNDVTKKRKFEDGCKPAVPKDDHLTIKSFFQKAAISATTSPVSTHLKSEKPAVNAFAMMMNRSREMAQKKKLDKAKGPPVPTLKVDAVKS